MKLSDITGYAENWPKRMDALDYYNVDYEIIEGHNRLHDQTSSLGIGIDWKKLRREISEAKRKWFATDKTEQLDDYVAQSVRPQKFLRIEKASHE